MFTRSQVTVTVSPLRVASTSSGGPYRVDFGSGGLYVTTVNTSPSTSSTEAETQQAYHSLSKRTHSQLPL